MGHCVKLVVPTLYGDTTFKEEEVSPIIDRIVQHWGGVTVSDAEGWWTDNEGKAVKDTLSVMECHIGPWNEETQEWWFRLADLVRTMWNQDCVMLSVSNSDGWLVTGPGPSDRSEIIA